MLPLRIDGRFSRHATATPCRYALLIRRAFDGDARLMPPAATMLITPILREDAAA